MPLPANIPDSIECLPNPQIIDESAFIAAESQLRVSDWRGLIEWQPELAPVTYEAYVRYEERDNNQYGMYGAVVLSLNGGAHNAPVIGYLGLNVVDEFEERTRIIPISVLISRTKAGAPFSYSARFLGAPSQEKFFRQRFFPRRITGFLL